MNRRNVISILALSLMVPATLIARPPKNKPESPSCKDCKKCGRACKCDCKKGCKCKPGCCRKGESPILDPAFERSPQSMAKCEMCYGEISNISREAKRCERCGHSMIGRRYDDRPYNKDNRFEKYQQERGLPSLSRNPFHYERMMLKFDENKDGKITGEEKKTAHRWYVEMASIWK
jgi:hypothetical protein